MDEIWKDITEFEGYYQVSNLGRVKSVDRVVEQINRWGQKMKRIHKGQILIPIKDKTGYLHVILWSNGKPKTKRIHRLVAEAFIENPDNLEQVNHKDEVKTNNCISNLEWCDRKYNSNYGTRNERMVEKLSKQVFQYTLSGELVGLWPSINEAGRNGFNQSAVCNCCLGKRKTYKGYIWSYVPL